MTKLEQTRALAADLSQEEQVHLFRWLRDQLNDQLEEIVHTPGVVGGRARLRGTRIPVWLIIDFLQQDMTKEQILTYYPQLSSHQIEAAWAYFEINREEIDRDIAEQEEE